MNDRVLSALRGLGIGAPPSAVLEREDAFFALLGDMLVYQDQNGTRRVTLRDLTRIHSGQEGLLRVETPAGTALTASLVGFDPGQVQSFFARVRDATAQAKNLPAAPLPTPGGPKTFGSMPKSVTPLTASPSPASTVVIGAAPGVPRVKEAKEERPAAPGPTLPSEAASVPPQAATVREVRAVPAPPSAGAAPVSPSRTKVEAKPEPVPTPTSAPAEPAPAAQVASAGAGSLLAGLAARANAVSGLVSRLQLLAAVLGLAAVGLAFFQYRADAGLQGLWTLIAGGVGCIALLAFADVTRLIVSLARAVAEGGGKVAEGKAAEGTGDRTDDAGT